jgi:MSHA biogenesis protein MshJ
VRLPPYLKSYVDRFDAMSLRERVLVFVASAAVLVMLADSALFEPFLSRQKNNSQRIQQQQDEIRAMQVQVLAYTQAGLSAASVAKRQRFEQHRQELAALDREIATKQRELATPDRMARMLSDILKRNPDIELMNIHTLATTDISQASPGAGGAGMYRHGVEIAVAGTYMNLLNYVGQLERMPVKLLWGAMELQAGQYPRCTLKITFFTLSTEKTWLVI